MITKRSFRTLSVHPWLSCTHTTWSLKTLFQPPLPAKIFSSPHPTTLTKRHKIICPCCNFICTRQSKTIKSFQQMIWKISLLGPIEKDNKNMTNEYRYFLLVNRSLVLVYPNWDADSKRFKTWRHYLPKGIINNCHHQWKKLLWPIHWFWFKIIWRN